MEIKTPPPTLEERVRAVELTKRNSMVRGFVLAFGCFALLFYAQAFSDRSDRIAACERANNARAVQLDLMNDLVEVNERRVDAPGASSSEVEANEFALREYTENRDALIDSQASVAVTEGSVEANCDEVYPPPFPFNVADDG